MTNTAAPSFVRRGPRPAPHSAYRNAREQPANRQTSPGRYAARGAARSRSVLSWGTGSATGRTPDSRGWLPISFIMAGPGCGHPRPKPAAADLQATATAAWSLSTGCTFILLPSCAWKARFRGQFCTSSACHCGKRLLYCPRASVFSGSNHPLSYRGCSAATEQPHPFARSGRTVEPESRLTLKESHTSQGPRNERRGQPPQQPVLSTRFTAPQVVNFPGNFLKGFQ